MNKLKDMLRIKRPGSGDVATEYFAEKYLYPVMGEPDEFGNYILLVKGVDDDVEPHLCFTAHYDTVHSSGGFQEVVEDEFGILKAKNSDCLGADCTTGLWLCLEMIDANIPGVYVVHADEESGCIGSKALVDSYPEWLDHIEAVISFDRKGVTSVVTHQMGRRTASEAFAKSFSEALGIPELVPDSGGVFTDSYEYADVVPECTNISVGYYSQHSSEEYQDTVFLQHLRDSLIHADWSKLVFKRDPSAYDYQDKKHSCGGPDVWDTWAHEDLYQLVLNHPEELSDWLHSKGVTADELAAEANIDVSGYVSGYLSRGELA